MNEKYQVKWAAVAESDLKDIIDYIANDSPVNALQMLKKMRQKVSSLITLPANDRHVCARVLEGKHPQILS